MSSLTIAIASLGGLVLAGVVAHGAWQARKAGPRRAADSVPITPLMEPLEPVMDAAATAQIAELPPPSLEPRAAKRSSVRLDALIDAIAPLTIEAPIS